jgi:hypothetical protein
LCQFFSLSLSLSSLSLSLSLSRTMSVFVDEIYIICGLLCCRNLILVFQKNLWEGRGFLFRWCLDEGPVCVFFMFAIDARGKDRSFSSFLFPGI